MFLPQNYFLLVSEFKIWYLQVAVTRKQVGDSRMQALSLVLFHPLIHSSPILGHS